MKCRAQELHFSFSFRLVTPGPSNGFQLQEFPSPRAKTSPHERIFLPPCKDLSPCKNFPLPMQGSRFLHAFADSSFLPFLFSARCFCGFPDWIYRTPHVPSEPQCCCRLMETIFAGLFCLMGGTKALRG